MWRQRRQQEQQQLGCSEDELEQARHDQLVAHRQQRSAEDDLEERGRPVHGRPSERQDQDHGPRERGVQGQADDATCRRASRRTSSSRGAAARSRSRPTPAWSRTSPSRPSRGSARSTPPASGSTRSTTSSTGSPTTSASWASGTTRSSSRRPGSTARPTTWNEFLADIQKLKSAGITPIAVGEKDKWPGMFWWANLSLRVAGKDAMAKAATDGGTFTQPGFVEAGKQLKKLIDLKPFQQGFLAAPWDGAGGEAAHDGQRQGGDGPDGPVGPVDLRGQHQGQEGPRRGPRLVPVPGRRRRRGPGGRAVRRRRRLRHRHATPRPRRSTSPSSSSAPTSPTRAAPAARILPGRRRAPRARSPIRT